MPDSRIDPRDFRTFRGHTIVDINETEYRVVGDYIERTTAVGGTPDKYEVSLVCAMEPSNVVKMIQNVQNSHTDDKATIHQQMKEYMLAEDHAMPLAQGRKFLGLLTKAAYMKSDHSWKKPAVLSKEINRIE